MSWTLGDTISLFYIERGSSAEELNLLVAGVVSGGRASVQYPDGVDSETEGLGRGVTGKFRTNRTITGRALLKKSSI